MLVLKLNYEIGIQNLYSYFLAYQYQCYNTNIDKLRNKSIGFVFQFHNLISELTLEENVSLPKMIAKEQLGKKELIELFEYFDLKDRMNSFPNDLSGGEKQLSLIHI